MLEESHQQPESNHFWNFDSRKDKLRLAAWIVDSSLLLLYICWFLWRRESPLRELGLLLSMPLAITIGLRIAINSEALNPNSLIMNEVNWKEIRTDLRETLAGLLYIAIFILIIGAVINLPAILMYLSGHPNSAMAWFNSAPANEYSLSDWYGFAVVITAGLGTILNRAEDVISDRQFSLKQKLKLLSRAFFVANCSLFVLLSTLELPQL